MGRNKAKELGKIARELLLAAGGNPAEASRYYAIAGGGADEIFGMIVSEEQFAKWKALGNKGISIFGELLSHAYDDPMAYGGYYYSLETLIAIQSGMALTYRHHRGCCV